MLKSFGGDKMKVMKSRSAVCGGRKTYYVLIKERYEGRTAYSLIVSERSAARTLFDIAATRAKAMLLFNVFVKNKVTPDEAVYVFDDISANAVLT